MSLKVPPGVCLSSSIHARLKCMVDDTDNDPCQIDLFCKAVKAHCSDPGPWISQAVFTLATELHEERKLDRLVSILQRILRNHVAEKGKTVAGQLWYFDGRASIEIYASKYYTLPSDPDFKNIKEAYSNLNYFLAKATKEFFHQGVIYAIHALRDALEHPNQKSWRLDYRVPIAAKWILVAGSIIFENCKISDKPHPSTMPGPLWKREGGSAGFSIKRWKYWQKRFGILRTNIEVNDGTRELVKEAFDLMNSITRLKFAETKDKTRKRSMSSDVGASKMERLAVKSEVDVHMRGGASYKNRQKAKHSPSPVRQNESQITPKEAGNAPAHTSQDYLGETTTAVYKQFLGITVGGNIIQESLSPGKKHVEVVTQNEESPLTTAQIQYVSLPCPEGVDDGVDPLNPKFVRKSSGNDFHNPPKSIRNRKSGTQDMLEQESL